MRSLFPQLLLMGTENSSNDVDTTALDAVRAQTAGASDEGLSATETDAVLRLQARFKTKRRSIAVPTSTENSVPPAEQHDPTGGAVMCQHTDFADK